MDEQTRAAIREGMEQARRGEFVPDVEIEVLWKQQDLRGCDTPLDDLAEILKSLDDRSPQGSRAPP